MQLALFDGGSHRVQAADNATSAADALTGVISEAGELSGSMELKFPYPSFINA